MADTLAAQIQRLAAPLPIDLIAARLRAETDPSAKPLLLRALSELTDPNTKPAVVALLIQQLTDGDLFVRALACTALGRIGAAACKEALQLASHDEEEWVRSAAKRALLMADAPSATAPVAAAPVQKELAQLQSLKLAVQQGAKDRLIAQGASVVPHVVPMLWHDTAPTRRAAAEILGQIASPKAIGPLLRLLAETETANTLRSIALHALASIMRAHGPEGVSLLALKPHLGAEDATVRAAALNALLQFGGRGKAIAARGIIEDDDDWVQYAGSKSLAVSLGSEDRDLRDILVDGLVRVQRSDSVVNLLVALSRVLDPVSASDPDLALAAIAALTRIGGPKAIAALARVANDNVSGALGREAAAQLELLDPFR